MDDPSVEEFLTLGKRLIMQSQLVTLFIEFTNRWIIGPFSRNPKFSDLVSTSLSTLITVVFMYLLVTIIVYKTIKHTLIYLGLVKPWGLDIFEPANCSHIYVSLNTIPEEIVKDKETIRKEGLSSLPKEHMEMEFPIVYHLEFDPKDFKDAEMGTDLKCLRHNVLEWFLKSQQFYLNKKKYRTDLATEHVLVFDDEGKCLRSDKDEEYLCDLGLENGKTVHAVITC